MEPGRPGIRQVTAPGGYLPRRALFGVGIYPSLTLVGDWRKNGPKMIAIGLGAAAPGFLIGHLFHTAGA